MQLSPTEISDLIKKRIEGSDLSAEAKTEGTIVAVTCLLYTSPSPRD